MVETPLVSVVITAFNRADTIVRAIDSVMAQTLADIEVVLVDDASTDDTVAVVERLACPKVRLIRNPKNLGIGGAKNVGIEAARGRYIAFLDSDDDWLPEKLERQVEALEKSGLQLCFTAFWVHRMDQNKVVVRCPRKYGSWLNSLLNGETFSLGSTLLATKECFDRVGLFNPALTRLQDRDWSIRYFDTYQDFCFLPEPLARIYNSGWPKAETVAKSTAALYQANRERLNRRDPALAHLFRTTLDFEVAVAHYRCGQPWMALWVLARLVAGRPSILPYLASRVMRKAAEGDFS